MKAYIYPVTARLKTGLHNPYLDNFVQSFEPDIHFLNFNQPSNSGIIDLWKYIWKVDVLFLNWVENIPDKKAGKFQWLIFLYAMYPILQFRKVKIVWTLHNKLSHVKLNYKIKQQIFDRLFRISDIIITHAGDGVELIEAKGQSNKALFFPHPMNVRNRYSAKNKDVDILIWGSIAPYKGIDAFLELVNKDDYLRNTKIVIAGKIIDNQYERKILGLLADNIKLINRFLSDEELDKYLANSRITLFTYNKESVLSSGALSDSLGFGNIVVGPDTGAFADLREEGLVYTFKNQEEIPDLCKTILTNPDRFKINDPQFANYIRNQSWDNFAIKISHKLRLNT